MTPNQTNKTLERLLKQYKTKKALAKALGITPRHLSRIENRLKGGKNPTRTMMTLIRLLAAKA